MKKIKTFATSLLCLLMSGAMLFSVGCGGSGANPNENSVPSGGTESTGGLTGGEKPSAGVASKDDKKYFFNTLAGTVGSIEKNPNQIIKVVIDLDVKTVETDWVYDETTYQDVEVTTVSDISFDAEAYGQYVNDVLAVDAWINGQNDYSYNSQNSTEYAYYAAYIRGDDLYYGGSLFEVLPTQVDKDALYYDKQSLSALIDAIMAEYGGMLGGSQGEVISTVAATEEESIGWQQILAENQDLIVKAATNVFNGLTANVEVNGDVLTLVLDFKKEAESLITVMESVVNSIGVDTSVSTLLSNQALETLFNKYLGDITAQELYQVLLQVLPAAGAPEEFMAFIKAPAAGASGYQYLVSTICSLVIDDITIGSQVLPAEAKEEALGIIDEVKVALAEVNALKFTMSVANNEFRGISFDIDINDVIDMYFSVALDMGVSYTFADVTALNLYTAE